MAVYNKDLKISRHFSNGLRITELAQQRSFSTTPGSLRTCRTTAYGLKRRYACIYMCRSRVVLTACGATWLHILILIVIQVELLAELVGTRCCAFLVAHRAKEIEFPLDASTSGGIKAIEVAVIGQMSMNLGDSDVMVKNRDRTSRKDEDDAFAKTLAGKLTPANHPFARLNKETTLFQPGRVFMQIWFYQSMNQPCKDKSGETLYDFKWQDFLSRMEISFQRKHFLTHGLKNTGNKSINGATRGLKNPGIGTDYLMAVIYIKKFCNQAGVAACKAATKKTDD